ncbi:MAG: hypothetical protein ABSB29_03085 [Nitrososphaerales archaeon]
MEQKQPGWLRVLEIVLGLLSITVALVVVLNHAYTKGTVPSLLVFAVLLNSVRIASAGGVRHLPALRRGLSLALGVAAAAIVVLVIVLPGLGFTTFALLLATGLAIQGLDRLSNVTHLGHPRWLRVSAFTVGLTTLALAGVIVAVPRLTTITLVAVLALTVSVNGIESIVVGIQPSTKKQLTLVKLVTFALFYGFVNINWIDLYYNRVPAYHIWLILTYMAPFVVLLVFQGFKDWQLAISLGLLVSLVNDLGYYISGDLLFGFHRQLIPWLSGQLGFQGGTRLFTFQGGFFTIPVTSYLMGASVYLRMAVVVAVLYHWWRRPADLPRQIELSPTALK